MKIHNFSAGPSILPKEVMHDASKAVKELGQSGYHLLKYRIEAKILFQLWMRLVNEL